jgi:hypothetical protein
MALVFAAGLHCSYKVSFEEKGAPYELNDWLEWMAMRASLLRTTRG